MQAILLLMQYNAQQVKLITGMWLPLYSLSLGLYNTYWSFYCGKIITTNTDKYVYLYIYI